VARIEKGKTKAAEYKEKKAQLAEDDADGFFALAMWCKSQRMNKEMKEELGYVLAVEPDHKRARLALGYRRVGNEWLTEEEARPGEGTAPQQKPEATVTGEPGKRTDGGRTPEPRTGKLPEGQAALNTPEARKQAVELYDKAVAAMREQHYDTALELLSKSLALDDRMEPVWSLRGHVNYLLRNMDKALADLDRALEIDPKSGFSLFRRALVFLYMGQPEKALADTEESLRNMPSHRGAQQYKGILQAVTEGPDWRRTFTRETRHYRVMTDTSQRTADFASRALENIYLEYARQFKFKGDELRRKFIVRIFATKDSFLEYMGETTGMRGDWMGGYYAPHLKELVLLTKENQDILTRVLYHEGFHQFLDYFISNVPMWFNEGLAQYFELAERSGRRFEMGKKDVQKTRLLRVINVGGATLSVRKLLRLTPKEFQDSGLTPVQGVSKLHVHYAESWAFIHFLIHSNKGKYKKVIRDFYLAMKGGKRPDEAFEDVFGRAKFGQVERALWDYVDELSE